MSGLAESSIQADFLVLGLGNDILSDDAVGLHIVKAIDRRVAGNPRIHVIATCEMGLSLLDFMVGFREVIIVDSVQTHTVPPGHLYEVDADALKTLPEMSPHFLGVGEVLSLGRQLGMPMPERVRIFAIEVGDPFTVSTEMTPVIRDAMPGIIERVMAVLPAP